MASLITSFHRLVNSLLPFTTPETPLFRDVIHTIVLCMVLYFIPVFAERRAQARAAAQEAALHNEDPQSVEAPDAEYGVDHTQNPTLNEARFNEFPIPRVDEENDNVNNFNPPPAPEPPNQPGQRLLNHPHPSRQRDNVGTKKAKSLARKEQRRAHFEFIREQAAAQRALDESAEAEREAQKKAAQYEANQAWYEREWKREEDRMKKKAAKEEKEQLERDRRIRCERVIKERLAEEALVDLGEIAEEVFEVDTDKSWDEMKAWVSNLAKAMPGVLGKRIVDEKLELTTILATGWIARIDAETMERVYAAAAHMGQDKMKSGAEPKITLTEIGHLLEDALLARAGG